MSEVVAMTKPPARGPRPVADLDEARLIRRSREGDVTAFEGLYRRFSPRVFGLCLRMAGDAGRAEELTQDVFVRVWEKLHLFRGNRPFAPWLLTVANNVVISALRSRKRKESRESLADQLDHRADPAPRRDSDTGMDLEQAVRSLPEGARAVFVLHEIEGYRHDEIADLLGMAVGTSKAQLHRARRMLRERLEP